MHQEIELLYQGAENSNFQVGPHLLLPGKALYTSETRELSFSVLQKIAVKSKIAGFNLSVKRVKVLDADDETIPGVVRKKNQVKVVWRGPEIEKAIRGLGTFRKNEPRDLDYKAAKRLVASEEFEILKE